jgi:hypothetical protein
MCKKYGLERLGFLTLTHKRNITDPKESQAMLHSLITHVLSVKYCAWIRVFERMVKGRIHYHLLVALPEGMDIKTGVDCRAIADDEDYSSATKDLRSEWAFWRKTAKDYGFGRTEMMPVATNAEAIAKYVGKYISKSVDSREERDKGVRLWACSSGAKVGNCNFAWHSPRSWLWRHKLAAAARALGFKSEQAFKVEFGPKWAYKLADLIMDVDLQREPGGVTYPTKAHAEADGRVFPTNADSGADDVPDTAVEIHYDEIKDSPKISEDPAPYRLYPTYDQILKVRAEYIVIRRRARKKAANNQPVEEETRFKDE